MRKLVTAFLLVVVVLGGTVSQALASGSESAGADNANAERAGRASAVSAPFSGTYEGIVYGDRSSEAEMQLELVQTGNEITGELTLGKGQYIDGVVCGRGYLPAGSFASEGLVSNEDPRLVEAQAAYKVSNATIKGTLTGQLSKDGNKLIAEVRIDLPWFCGKDPVLQVEAGRTI